MKKRILFIVISMCLTLVNRLHAQEWKWSQRIGNTKSDKITSIKTDSLGYIYISGYFSNNTTIGTNALPLTYTANSHSKEIFLAKLDSLGYCYWARSGGEIFDDRVLGMDVDAQGNSVITGTFWQIGAGLSIGSVNITGSGFGAGDQCFVAKHDNAGNILWGTFVSSNMGDDQGLDVATDKAGNSYVVGFMTGNILYCGGSTVTATNSNTGWQKHSYWLAKVNSAGTFQWAKCFGNLPYDTSASKYIERDIAVCVDDSGGVYVTGGYDHTWPFGNTTLTSTGGYDVFIMKYDSAGNFQWVKNAGSKKDDWSNGICYDGRGSIYVVGEHRDSLIMDTVLVKNYDRRDAFILKIDAKTGSPLWGKRAGSNLGGERGNDVVADTLCNVYFCGDINEGAKFGDNIVTPLANKEQAFVAKLSPDGKWQWATVGGGVDSNDRANAIALGVGNQIYVAGFFRSPATYGTTPTLSSVGSSDGFFAKLYDSTYNQGEKFSLIRPTDTVICKEASVVLNIPPHAYLTYTPTTGVTANSDMSQLSFSHVGSNTTYTLSGFSKSLCPDYDTISFTIVSAPDPVAEFVINPKEASSLNPTFTLTNQSTGATTYKWYYDGSIFSTDKDTKKILSKPGEYCFTLFAYNDAGCVDSTTHCARIYDPESVFFPNAFTPNGDARNEGFAPKYLNIDLALIKDYQLTIVDRWGRVIFNTTRPELAWNGRDKMNHELELGPYYYFCKFTTPRGQKIEQKGDVTLIR